MELRGGLGTAAGEGVQLGDKGRLDCSSVGEGLLHGSLRRLIETVHGSKQFIVMAEKGCIKPYPTSQIGPEIKYLWQGGMSGKGSFGKALLTSTCLISMENSVLNLLDCGHISFPIVLV